MLRRVHRSGARVHEGNAIPHTFEDLRVEAPCSNAAGIATRLGGCGLAIVLKREMPSVSDNNGRDIRDGRGVGGEIGRRTTRGEALISDGVLPLSDGSDNGPAALLEVPRYKWSFENRRDVSEKRPKNHGKELLSGPVNDQRPCFPPVPMVSHSSGLAHSPASVSSPKSR